MKFSHIKTSVSALLPVANAVKKKKFILVCPMLGTNRVVKKKTHNFIVSSVFLEVSNNTMFTVGLYFYIFFIYFNKSVYTN